MELKDKKIVIWCGDAPNQRALACKVAAQFNLAGIVLDEHKVTASKHKQPSFFQKLVDRFRFAKIYGAWKSLMGYYNSQYPLWPDVPVLRVPTVNDERTALFTKEQGADLVVVSGTALIKKPLVNLQVPAGIINLHTGLSPYVKGGPNCTNWCIANNEWHLVGNTIMWLNAGIDSGNIITTERLDIRQAKSLNEAHLLVMEHAHDLYIRCIGYLLSTSGTPNSIPQNSIAEGNLYLTKMWTAAQRKALLANWRSRANNRNFPDIKTVPLPNAY